MRRRRLIQAGAALLGLGSIAWWQRNELTRWALTQRRNAEALLTASPELDEDACLLTPEQIEGPFFVRSPVRSDIREDRSGLPLDLRMQLVSADGCEPIEGAVVEVWHCDAAGRYSGYPEHLSRRPLDSLLFLDGPDAHVEPFNNYTYLRGAQTTDAHGRVGFQTIFPGWYEPRVTHIHVKVFLSEKSLLTTQLYFPDELVRDIYSSHADYLAHRISPYSLGNDMVLGRNPEGSGLLIRVEREEDRLVGSVKLGVAQAEPDGALPNAS